MGGEVICIIDLDEYLSDGNKGRVVFRTRTLLPLNLSFCESKKNELISNALINYSIDFIIEGSPKKISRFLLFPFRRLRFATIVNPARSLARDISRLFPANTSKLEICQI